MYNTHKSPSPPPKYEWFPPGVDQPRLTWAQYLRLWADEVDRACGGEVGHHLGGWFLSLAIQAEALQAFSPEDHQVKAMLEAEREAAWVRALEAEAMSPGIWTVTVQDEGPDGSRRGWFADNADDATYRN